MVSLVLFMVGVFFQLFVPLQLSAYIYAAPMWLKAIQSITHMLSHAGWMHLFGNFSYGAPFMAYAESKIKSWKEYLGIYLACGFAALGGQNLAQAFSMFKSSGSVGSSGAIFGIVGFALTSAAKEGPKSLRLAALAILAYYFVLQGLLAWDSLSGWGSGVAYAAHLSGLLVGVLAVWRRPIFAWTRQRLSR